MLKKTPKTRSRKSPPHQRNRLTSTAKAPHPQNLLSQVPEKAALPPQSPRGSRTPVQGRDSTRTNAARLRRRWRPLSTSPWPPRRPRRRRGRPCPPPSTLAATTSPTPVTGSCTLSTTATTWNWTPPSTLPRTRRRRGRASLPRHWCTSRHPTSGVPLNLWQNQLPKKAKLSQKLRSLNLLYQRTQLAATRALLWRRKPVQ